MVNNDDEHVHRYVDGGICERCGEGMPLTMAMGWAELLLQEAIDTMDHATGSTDGLKEHLSNKLYDARQHLIEYLPFANASPQPEPEDGRRYTCLEFAFLAGGDTCTIGSAVSDPHFHVHGEDGWDVY